MKLVFFVENYLSPSETFIMNQIAWFDARYEVSVLCLTSTKHHHSLYKIPKPNSLLNRVSKKLRYISKSSIKTRVALERFLDEEKPDLIHCHFGIQALTVLDNLRSTSLPVFVTFHGYDTKKYLSTSIFYRRRWKRLFSQSHIHPIFVCKFHQNLFASFGIKSGNSVLLYNGVSLDQFKRTQYPKDTSFVQVSRFTEKKGHLYTIKAFERFREQNPSVDFSLTFLGQGHLLPHIQNQLSTSNIKDVVHFKEWTSNVKEELQKHKFYVQHSITADDGDIEATSISILEAMAMEMPVLSTNHAGIPETITHGKNGLLVEEKDIDQMVNAINEIIQWDYLKNNRDRVGQEFNLEQRNHCLEKYYLASLS